VPFYGAVVLCNDEENLRAIRPNLKRKVITYGLNADAEFQAIEIDQSQASLKFKVRRRTQSVGILGIEAAGLHNVKNALAAVAVGFEIGLSLRTFGADFQSSKGCGGDFKFALSAETMRQWWLMIMRITRPKFASRLKRQSTDLSREK
jgi:UDP-N-acetylmuramate--alanine ligase